MFASVSTSAVGIRVAVGGSGVGVLVGVDEGDGGEVGVEVDGGGVGVEVDGGGVAVTTKTTGVELAGGSVDVAPVATDRVWSPNEMLMSQASSPIVTSRMITIPNTRVWFFIFAS